MYEQFTSLSELQQDTLQECFNIGIGKAGRSLSHLMRTEVAMSPPVMLAVTSAQTNALIDPALQSSEACAVLRNVSGIDAQVAMVFQGSPQAMAALLPPLLTAPVENRDHQAEAATKMAYLVIESCIDQLEALLGRSIDRQPVKYLPSVPAELFRPHLTPERPLVVIRVDLRLRRHGISGHLFFTFSEEAANQMAVGLDRVLRDSERPVA